MSGQSADVYDLGGDINAFAPTNPQSQPPGTQGTPLTPVLPKSSLPKSPPSQAPGADQPQSAPQSQPAPQTAQPSTNSPDVYDLGEPQAQEPTQKTFPPSPDTSAMTNYVAKNLNTNIPNDGDLQHFSQAEGTIPGTPTQAKTFKEALEAGLQLGMIGTIATKNNPSYVVPQDADWTMDMVGKIGELAGSALEIAGGMAAGANIGAIGGGLTMGIPGAAVGAVVGAGAGAFGVPQAIRKMLVDHYEKGDIKDPADFAQRLMGTAWEGIKGSITGAATTLTGGAAGYAYGTMGQLMSELTTMTGVGQALEGQLPKWKDFRDNAIMLGGLHAIPHVVGKLHNMYANLGLKPDEVRQAAQNDIVLYQYLINRDWHVPEGAGPSELQHFSQADGTIPP